ncbi:MAG: tryptophanyl-tRNA synthetase [archaeon GW2011_AR10]|uniref:Tryptophan--tRNA ligase n=2 Tax=Candidatus Iainarchaeum sp. TaxID=3101447 RepID=A0A7J4IW80_9ARCH|nr:MAG: tryptophanyl-tRNA synthetase [archaeon GW2011_AR10]HIH08505.1 tryptophan--tRNA ligase [Candidatus Diapherotrites archaeon]
MARIDPWGSGQITDYEHVFKEFGLKPFPEKWSSSLKHYLFERNIVVAHRDFDLVFQKIKTKKPFVNMTGIASSGQLHLGHKADLDLFFFFKKSGARNYFSVSDLDAYLSRPDSSVPSIKKAKQNAVDNLAHALALGLTEKDVYVQSQGSRKNPRRYFEFSLELSKKITKNTFEAVYGHVDLGKVAANFLQYADIIHPQLEEFEGKMPSVTGIGIEQDPHARLTRDVARRLPYDLEVPSFIYFQHQSGLREGSKMSSSLPETAVFLNDSAKDAERKIRNAFTGGRPTAEEQKKLGGNPEICKVCELLRFHFPDSKKLGKHIEDYRSGKILDRENKQFAVDFMLPWLEKHQEKAKEKRELAEQIVSGQN